MISILKLDHRPERDKRITTHCALVARAFGANKFYYSGIEDNNIKKNIDAVNNKWGSKFEIEYTAKPIKLLVELKKKNKIIHLTMYGEKIITQINTIKQNNNIIIVVGGPKVEKRYYELADYNISITNQPQSEVGALAITLYLLNPQYLEQDFFDNQKIKITPSNKYKKVTTLK